jgi:hypothetical protein
MNQYSSTGTIPYKTAVDNITPIRIIELNQIKSLETNNNIMIHEAITIA